MALQTWKHYEDLGIVSPKRETIVISANDRLISKSSKLNDYYLQKLQEYGVKIQYNQKLTRVNKGTYKTFYITKFIFYLQIKTKN